MPKTIAAFPLRLETELIEQLKVRAQLDNKSMNSIVIDALREYFRSRPITTEQVRDFAARAMKKHIWDAFKDD
jgi:hypothetical protein